jgi:hypothetical protein
MVGEEANLSKRSCLGRGKWALELNPVIREKSMGFPNISKGE